MTLPINNTRFSSPYLALNALRRRLVVEFSRLQDIRASCSHQDDVSVQLESWLNHAQLQLRHLSNEESVLNDAIDSLQNILQNLGDQLPQEPHPFLQAALDWLRNHGVETALPVQGMLQDGSPEPNISSDLITQQQRLLQRLTSLSIGTISSVDINGLIGARQREVVNAFHPVCESLEQESQQLSYLVTQNLASTAQIRERTIQASTLAQTHVQVLQATIADLRQEICSTSVATAVLRQETMQVSHEIKKTTESIQNAQANNHQKALCELGLAIVCAGVCKVIPASLTDMGPMIGPSYSI